MIKSVKFITYKSQKLRKNQQIFTFEKVVFNLSASQISFDFKLN